MWGRGLSQKLGRVYASARCCVRLSFSIPEPPNTHTHTRTHTHSRAHTHTHALARAHTAGRCHGGGCGESSPERLTCYLLHALGSAHGPCASLPPTPHPRTPASGLVLLQARCPPVNTWPRSWGCCRLLTGGETGLALPAQSLPALEGTGGFPGSLLGAAGPAFPSWARWLLL